MTTSTRNVAASAGAGAAGPVMDVACNACTGAAASACTQSRLPPKKIVRKKAFTPKRNAECRLRMVVSYCTDVYSTFLCFR
jgi:hypothetical protein